MRNSFIVYFIYLLLINLFIYLNMATEGERNCNF